MPVAVTARYTEQVVALVTPETREWLDKEADTRNMSLSEVVREKLDKAHEMEEEPNEEPIPEG